MRQAVFDRDPETLAEPLFKEIYQNLHKDTLTCAAVTQAQEKAFDRDMTVIINEALTNGQTTRYADDFSAVANAIAADNGEQIYPELALNRKFKLSLTAAVLKELPTDYTWTGAQSIADTVKEMVKIKAPEVYRKARDVAKAAKNERKSTSRGSKPSTKVDKHVDKSSSSSSSDKSDDRTSAKRDYSDYICPLCKNPGHHKWICPDKKTLMSIEDKARDKTKKLKKVNLLSIEKGTAFKVVLDSGSSINHLPLKLISDSSRGTIVRSNLLLRSFSGNVTPSIGSINTSIAFNNRDNKIANLKANFEVTNLDKIIIGSSSLTDSKSKLNFDKKIWSFKDSGDVKHKIPFTNDDGPTKVSSQFDEMPKTPTSLPNINHKTPPSSILNPMFVIRDLNSIDTTFIGGCDFAASVNLVELAPKTAIERLNRASYIKSVASMLVDKFDELLSVVSQDFAGLPVDRGAFNFTIETDGTIPKSPIYPIPHKFKEELKMQLNEYLTKQWIVRSKTPYAAPVTFARKPGGAWRMCIDYRALNKISLDKSHPITPIDKLVMRTKGVHIFSKLDLAKGYHQLLIVDKDKEKTGFRTEFGTFHFNVMPFGVKGAPSTFQAYMDHIFEDLINEGIVLVYFDDILITTRTDNMEQHFIDKNRVLERLKLHGLHVAKNKCFFDLREVEYLGYIVNGITIRPMRNKTDEIAKWAVPKNANDVRRFLGIVNYYHKYIPNLVNKTRRLSELIKKNSHFKWTRKHREDFEFLRTAVSDESTLFVPNYENPFYIDTDASQYGLGYVIYQMEELERRHILYGSKTFSSAERNYTVLEKEFLAIITSLRNNHYMLFNYKTHVRTDHQNITFIYSQMKVPLSDRISRWVQILSSYNPILEYISGGKNVYADAISRSMTAGDKLDEKFELTGSLNDSPIAATWNDSSKVITYNVHETKEVNLVETSSIIDKEWSKLLMHSFDDDSVVPLILRGYTAENNLISCKAITKQKCYKQYDTDERGLRFVDKLVIVPQIKVVIRKIISMHHDHWIAGHFSYEKTLEKISRGYVWDTMNNDIKNYCSSCLICQAASDHRIKPMGLLQPLPIPSRPNESISIDLIPSLPTCLDSNGIEYNAILVIVDRLTKFVSVFSLPKSPTSSSVIECIDKFIMDKGSPLEIVMDSDPLFTSNESKAHFKARNIELKPSLPYHHQSNGQVEIFIRLIKNLLRKLLIQRDAISRYHMSKEELSEMEALDLDMDLEELRTDWLGVIQHIAFAINNTLCSSTGHTPFMALYGHNAMPTLMEETRTPITKGSMTFVINERLQKMNDLIRTIRSNLSKAMKRAKLQYDKRHKPITLSIGDYIFIRVRDDEKMFGKLDNNYTGPYRVTSIDGLNVKYAFDTGRQGKENIKTIHVGDIKVATPNKLNELSDNLSPDLADVKTRTKKQPLVATGSASNDLVSSSGQKKRKRTKSKATAIPTPPIAKPDKPSVTSDSDSEIGASDNDDHSPIMRKGENLVSRTPPTTLNVYVKRYALHRVALEYIKDKVVYHKQLSNLLRYETDNNFAHANEESLHLVNAVLNQSKAVGVDPSLFKILAKRSFKIKGKTGANTVEYLIQVSKSKAWFRTDLLSNYKSEISSFNAKLNKSMPAKKTLPNTNPGKSS
eukprot:gene3852-4449_t